MLLESFRGDPRSIKGILPAHSIDMATCEPRTLCTLIGHPKEKLRAFVKEYANMMRREVGTKGPLIAHVESLVKRVMADIGQSDAPVDLWFGVNMEGTEVKTFYKKGPASERGFSTAIVDRRFHLVPE
jgi:hypothetical protein